MTTGSGNGFTVLSNRAITVGAVLVLTITLGLLGLLLSLYWDQQPDVILNVIRTSASLGAGTGGGVALLLTARRQRSTELELTQKELDATENRVTELYGKAAEQLGSDKAPVRLAGIFALERLGQAYPPHRQTIVDLICAYLRMPVGSAGTGSDSGLDESDLAEPEEFQVRLAAQEVLTKHLRRESDDSPAPQFWPDVVVNLSGAVLHTFIFTRCRVHSATFAGATFVGPAVFRGAVFEKLANFRGARFSALADFRRVDFHGEGVIFRGASFGGEVDFGTNTTADLTGACVRAGTSTRRRWPDGWAEVPGSDQPEWLRLSEENRSLLPGTTNR